MVFRDLVVADWGFVVVFRDLVVGDLGFVVVFRDFVVVFRDQSEREICPG